MTTIVQSPLPASPASVVPPASTTADDVTQIASSPQPQAAAVSESEAVLNALQNLVAAETTLAQTVNAALPSAAASQGGLAQLLADLIQAQQTQELPAPVQAAIVDILALRSPIDAPIAGDDIKAALANSGLFSEAKAAARLQSANPEAQIPPPASDIKTALLVLRQTLTTWLSDAPTSPEAPNAAKDAPPAPSESSSGERAPQTYRGVATSNAPVTPAPVASSVASSPQTPVTAAPGGPASPQAQIPSPSQIKGAQQNFAATDRATSETASPNPEAPPRPTDKTAAPILQQAPKSTPSLVRAAPDVPVAAKSALPELLRAPNNNPNPPAYRAASAGPPSFAPASPVSASSVLASPAPVASPAAAQAVPNTQANATAQAAAQAVPNTQANATAQAAPAPASPAPEAIAGSANEAPPQSAAPEAATNSPPPAAANTGALPAGTDLKLALGLLQQLLKTSLDTIPAQPYAPETEGSPTETRQSAASNLPPPPYRGGPTSAQPALPSTLPAEANPRLVGQVLLNHTNAALAHLKLLQIASLPDLPQASPQNADQGPRWMFEIPFATPNGSAIAQFEIRRDGRGRTAEPSGPVWRARFSLDIEPIGPIHAQIVLTDGRAFVTLWAEREASVQALRQNEKLLSQALKETDVVPEVAFYWGAPHRRLAPAGQFLDRAS